MALWLGLVFQGLGQLYAGRPIRGSVFVLAGLVEIAAGIMILRDLVLNPASKIGPVYFAAAAAGSALGIFSVFDAYRSAKSFNRKHQLQCEHTPKKWTLFIAAYLTSSMLVNPAAYVKNNYVQSFRIPAASMSPTLMTGDKLFVDKAVYRRSEPKRGDVVVFRYPLDKTRFFIKRVAAFAGESVEIKDGKVCVDGKALDDPETFGRFYYDNHEPYGKPSEPVKVPANSYYVLGDNSAASVDSRFWGFVSREDLVGKAVKIWWPVKRTSAVK